MVFASQKTSAVVPLVGSQPHPHSMARESDDTAAAKAKAPVTTASKTKARKLSTERSRLCRQRQKQYADNLERSVKSLREEVQDLIAIRTLRMEQILNTPAAPTGSFARLIREYCNVFEHGMALDGALLPQSRKRTISATAQLTAKEQRAFMTYVMDPDVEVFDWMGRSTTGPTVLLNGWKAWSEWHSSLMFDLKSFEVLTTDETVAVKTRGFLCVRVSEETIKNLFPHVADDENMRSQLMGREIRYPFGDTFYFNSEGRVGKYICDIDFIGALTDVFNDIRRVMELVEPPNAVSLNDRAIDTGEHPNPCLSRQPERDQRLQVDYLLS
ncbi:hypothetical protein Poli38472_014289 [Pythium oligandrum]|uniref:Uncharacterized protein n=1 Tax=Pythium oligandrum TaxID=41045 RepID=A0A8K1FLU0_PYTOL|nr:hypothetical protein Poli38472_014289 [Pythium oligandrum]|eukprot:TMW64172.1 hypothetical protein Poli38472_014289 [Pythium oligandrum]